MCANDAGRAPRKIPVALVPVEECEGNVPVEECEGNAPGEECEGNAPVEECEGNAPVEECEGNASGSVCTSVQVRNAKTIAAIDLIFTQEVLYPCLGPPLTSKMIGIQTQLTLWFADDLAAARLQQFQATLLELPLAFARRRFTQDLQG